ncbi:class I SAM-dependent methyltransferase [Corallococcus praedator]|uniref:Class I SAM-dependent methyltransferase n=1 Tax=Corallococcus praedator TaxID=2316724 RepID=A0ABX9QQU8_9BACT|nr:MULTISPECIES: class I SAM-dependent methyltransferase [Corallococcus]RKH14001.1 class I SAM-dependent methyltransferase [Corallococcus sp. CA047B]RKH27098.1 class I SAM-dependent methyltransferase [Corallococcus sp. CA031C]RKI14221.1 class I SAM-dependent methyltransferase [Corallococcus praedator]
MFHRDGPTFRELTRQALTSVEHGYDLLAPKFEHTPFRTPDAVLKASLAQVGPERSVGAALDVCCGTGAAMRVLRPLCRDRVVGLDLSQGMLDEARQLLRDAPGDAALDFVRGDALELPFTEAFDLITSFGAFGHILEADEPRLVKGIARALKPGGRFVFVTGHPPSALNPGYWVAKGFNAAMRVRNALWKPPFVMYYLTFLVPRARALLEAEGFTVEVREGGMPKPFTGLVTVHATKR